MRRVKIFSCIIFMLCCLTGCFYNNEKELCDKMLDFEVEEYKDVKNYEGLALVLEGYNKSYCNNSDSEICELLDEYIENVKHEVVIEDCSKRTDSYKDICKYDNDLAVVGKDIKISYSDNKLYLACHKKYDKD